MIDKIHLENLVWIVQTIILKIDQIHLERCIWILETKSQVPENLFFNWKKSSEGRLPWKRQTAEYIHQYSSSMGSEGIGDDDKYEAVDNDEVGNDDGNADDDLNGILIHLC